MAYYEYAFNLDIIFTGVVMKNPCTEKLLVKEVS